MPTPFQKTILLVDDHEATRRVLSVLLRQIGYDVRIAPSGHAAIHLLDVLRPDAVVLDLSMPDMSGIQVLQRMRMDPLLVHTPVLIFSGDREALEACQGLRAEEKLLKGSLSWRTLIQRLEALIEDEPELTWQAQTEDHPFYPRPETYDWNSQPPPPAA